MVEQPEHLLHDLDGLLIIVGRKVEKLEGGWRVCGAKTFLEGEVLLGVGGMTRMSLTNLATSWGRAPMMWANLVASAVIFNVKTCSAWANQTLGSSTQKGVSFGIRCVWHGGQGEGVLEQRRKLVKGDDK